MPTTTSKSMESTTTDDPVVTRLGGGYMTVDTDKLLKSEEAAAAAAIAKRKLSKVESKAKPNTPKFHYIPQPLLEPQSPSLPNDIEVDVSLPNAKRNDSTTTVKTNSIDNRNSENNANNNNNNNDNSNCNISKNDNNKDNNNSGKGNDDIDGNDETSGEFDLMSYYSDEDVLTTKELIDDMAKIMAHGAEMRRNQMNHKAKFMRKSHGACFTGADR